jgi:hypothetical protein
VTLAEAQNLLPRQAVYKGTFSQTDDYLWMRYEINPSRKKNGTPDALIALVRKDGVWQAPDIMYGSSFIKEMN